MKTVLSKYKYLSFKDISTGDCFLYKDNVYLKIHKDSDYDAVSLNSGHLKMFNCDEMVYALPNAEVQY